MNPIYIKREFEDGYIQVQYENHGWCNWQRFVPDPRKRKHHCLKFWAKQAAYGTLDGLCNWNLESVVTESARPLYAKMHAQVREMLMEAARRYDQRYAKYGELGNSQMPADPDMEAFCRVVSEMVNKKMFKSFPTERSTE